jgi:hypothetical protein
VKLVGTFTPPADVVLDYVRNGRAWLFFGTIAVDVDGRLRALFIERHDIGAEQINNKTRWVRLPATEVGG